MPQLDMPMDQLKNYKGINPKPNDLAEYWQRALDEMKAVESNVELIPSKFKAPDAECFDLYFTGVGGARIHAKYLRPKNLQGKAPAVLQFHGYTGNSGSWLDKVAYASNGIHVAALDCRGQGGLSEDCARVSGNTHHGHFIRGLSDGPDKLLMRDVFLDTAQLAKIVMDMPDVDESKVGAMGGSQGGALTLACAALEPRIAKAAPVYPFLSDYLRVWELDLDIDAYKELRTHLRSFDPIHENIDEFFMTLGYIDVAQLAPRIKAEVLFTATLMDNICPPSTQFAAYNNISSKKDIVIYPDFGHEHLPGSDDRIFTFMAEML